MATSAKTVSPAEYVADLLAQPAVVAVLGSRPDHGDALAAIAAGPVGAPLAQILETHRGPLTDAADEHDRLRDELAAVKAQDTFRPVATSRPIVPVPVDARQDPEWVARQTSAELAAYADTWALYRRAQDEVAATRQACATALWSCVAEHAADTRGWFADLVEQADAARGVADEIQARVHAAEYLALNGEPDQ